MKKGCSFLDKNQKSFYMFGKKFHFEMAWFKSSDTCLSSSVLVSDVTEFAKVVDMLVTTSIVIWSSIMESSIMKF